MLRQSNNFFLRLTCLLILTYWAILLYIVVARTKKWLPRAIGQSNCRSLLLAHMLGVADHRLKLDPTLKKDMTSQCFSSILHTSTSATFLLPRVFTCQEKISVCDSILPSINTQMYNVHSWSEKMCTHLYTHTPKHWLLCAYLSLYFWTSSQHLQVPENVNKIQNGYNHESMYCYQLHLWRVSITVQENIRWLLALARRSKFSDTARNPAKQRSISSAVLRSLMSVGNATDKAEWRRTYGQIPLFGRPPWSICISGFYVSLENFIGFWTKSSREVGLPYMEPCRRLGRHIWLVMNYSCL